MEPPNEIYDRTHRLFDEKGSEIDVSAISNTYGEDTRQSTIRASRVVHSVLLAEGIHYSVDPDELDELPRRFETGSSKATLTWFGALCMAGIGMFVEAYIIITTGQIKTIWHAQYPTCFDPEAEMHCPDRIQCSGLFTNEPEGFTPMSDICNPDGTYPEEFMCEQSVVHGISYSEFAGIMMGMLAFGKIADLTGRHFAGILAALFQIVGVTVMTFYMNDDLNTQFLIFTIFFGIFGFGIGGEYPLTAAGAAAHHVESLEDAEMDDSERHRVRVLREKERTARRGETISIVFAMQGVGAVVGSLFICILLYFGQQNHHDCEKIGNNPTGNDPLSLNAIWRTFYFIGAIFTSMVLVYRGLVLEEGTGHEKLLARKLRRAEKLGNQGSSTLRILSFYGPRLIGTGGCWFVWDVAFYGLKLFSGPIFNAINPDGDLIVQNGYLLVNNLCALAGYYCSAYVIDWPSIGRMRLQIFSFIMCAILFSTTGAIFNYTSPQVLMALYFLSSFFGQFGANVTTYVMAAETYPTELRATCHGISAFLGKCGALMATIVFGQITPQQIFFICGGVSVAGIFFTIFFSCDLTLVSLAEHDAQLELFLEGRLHEYKGKLNDPKHCSLFERVTGRNGKYDPHWAVDIVRNDIQKAKDQMIENNLLQGRRTIQPTHDSVVST